MKHWLIGLFLVPMAASAQQDSLDIKIGQMIIMGLDDFTRVEKRQPMLQSIENGTLGNIIIYGKHIDAKKPEREMQRLTEYIQSIAPIPVFIGIDEEGGKVNRLKAEFGFPVFIGIDEEGGKVNRLKAEFGFPRSVSAQYLGGVNREDSTRHYARQTAGTLRSLGINMNFAPVVDVNVNTQNPVIGMKERSYSTNHHVVTRHAAFVVAEQRQLGVVNVLKHFPGHGSSDSDTHLGMADVSGSWVIEELFPFNSLVRDHDVPAVMTAHIVNERLDSTRLPATLSHKIITGLLREFMGFDGLVISDDMQMHAISQHYGVEDAIVLSINAGVDMVMFANNSKLAARYSPEDLHAIIKTNVLNGKIPARRVDESFRRIMKLKRQL